MNTIRGWNGTERQLADVLACVGPGWHPLITRLVDDLFALGWNGDLHQIKEKFGGLRFYIGEGTAEIDGRIEVAYAESERTCENCAAPGKPRGGGWIRTLCDKCQGGT